MKQIKVLAIGFCLTVLVGCASTGTQVVPMKVQSDPLGAYVLFQVQSDRDGQRSYDWIFLGSTPLDTRKEIFEEDLDHADAFILKVIKEGYLDQQKAFTGKDFAKETKEKGSVFWNPKLVPAN